METTTKQPIQPFYSSSHYQRPTATKLIEDARASLNKPIRPSTPNYRLPSTNLSLSRISQKILLEPIKHTIDIGMKARFTITKVEIDISQLINNIEENWNAIVGYFKDREWLMSDTADFRIETVNLLTKSLEDSSNSSRRIILYSTLLLILSSLPADGLKYAECLKEMACDESNETYFEEIISSLIEFSLKNYDSASIIIVLDTIKNITFIGECQKIAISIGCVEKYSLLIHSSVDQSWSIDVVILNHTLNILRNLCSSKSGRKIFSIVLPEVGISPLGILNMMLDETCGYSNNENVILNILRIHRYTQIRIILVNYVKLKNANKLLSRKILHISSESFIHTQMEKKH
jgi:hypothetical protein